MITTLKKYESVQDTIHQIFRSRLQIKILLSLADGKKNLTDLRNITGSSSQAILPIIRKLESSHLIYSMRTEYSLTPMGRTVYAKIQDCVFTIDVLKNQNEFWENHYLEGIPPVFLEDIGDLRDCRIISDTMVDIFQVYSNFLNIVKKAKCIYSVSSIMSPGHADAIAARVPDGFPIHLVVSTEVAAQMKLEPYREKLTALQKYDNFSVSAIQEPIKIGLLITDTCLSLGLYKNDGITYDISTDLMSTEKTAISWGKKIFHYYQEQSIPITF
jgi:predicted transcriptional regulator